MMHITEIASWPVDDNNVNDHSDREDALAFAFALECIEGFHTHSNGMDHITIDLTADEREKLAGFVRAYYSR